MAAAPTDKYDETVAWRLSITRELLSEARQRSSNSSQATLMLALLSLGEALELAVFTLGPLTGARVAGNDWSSYQAWAKVLFGKYPALQRHTKRVDRVREARNGVQHHALVPDARLVPQMCVEAEEFIRAAVWEVLGGIELEEISLSAQIRDPEARRHVTNAENALRASDRAAAVIAAARALNGGPWRSGARRGVSGPMRVLTDALARAADLKDPTLQQFASKVAFNMRVTQVDDELQRALQPIELARHGVEIDRYVRFQDVTRAVRMIWAVGVDEPTIRTPHGWSPSEGDARFAVVFARSAILRIQERLPTPPPPDAESDS